ncbi:hypothetical protein VTN96DRAFT_8865 [Rasamsonia emersonii]
MAIRRTIQTMIQMMTPSSTMKSSIPQSITLRKQTVWMSLSSDSNLQDSEEAGGDEGLLGPILSIPES